MTVVVPTMCQTMDEVAAAVHRLAGWRGTLIAQAARDWRSTSFSGARHVLTFAFDGLQEVTQGEKMIAALPAFPFAIEGHIVADTDVTHIERRADPPRLVVDCKLLLLETP